MVHADNLFLLSCSFSPFAGPACCLPVKDIDAVLGQNAGGAPRIITEPFAAFPELEALATEPSAFDLDRCWDSRQI